MLSRKLISIVSQKYSYQNEHLKGIVHVNNISNIF